jgi:hypothetical protein
MHKNVSQCLEASVLYIIPEIFFNENSTVGDVRLIRMDNEIVKRIVSRKFQVIRAALSHNCFLEDNGSRLALILFNYDSYLRVVSHI